MLRTRTVVTLLSLLLVAAGWTSGQAQKQASGPEPAAFFRNLKQLCGKRFAGKAVFTPTPEDPMAKAVLAMHVASCKERELRIPFLVGEDRSRTWLLTLQDDGLLFKHDHRHDDNTPDEVTDYGGMSAPGGTAWKQSFPADAHTAKLIPAAATNVWTLEIEREKGTPVRFIYDLKRNGQQRFRAVFDLTKPLS